MNWSGVISLVCLASASGLGASGPADRAVTDPKSVTSPAKAGAGPIGVADLLQTTRIGGMTVSRDGSRIAYLSNASGRFNLWSMNADGTNARQLTHSNERETTPVFSHDGETIVYMEDKGGDEMYDLYAIPAIGGEARNLTNSALTSETSPLFSPDGSMLAIGSKEKDNPFSNLAVMAWPTGTVRLLTHESDPKATWNSAVWSRDCRYLFAARSVAREDSDIYRIDVASGAAQKLTTHDGKHVFTLGEASPDGKTLLLSSNEKGGFGNVLLLDLATKRRRWVTDTQWEADAGQFSPDGATFTYSLNADGRTTIKFVDSRTLAESGRGVPTGLNSAGARPNAFLPDGSYLLAHQDSTHPANLFVLQSGQLRQITHNESPAVSAAVLPSSQLVTYRSFDGSLISAFVWVPFNLERNGSAAAVVLPHGGPTGQTVDSFDARAVLLVSRGFVVIAPNVRGSTGYGMKFQKANFQDLGGGDLKDEIAGVEFLKATGFVDAKRIGIWGGSYGGFMTLMAIGKTPGVWSAAVDEYGILNWLTMLEHEDASLQAYEKTLLGDPDKDRAAYEACSPLKYIHSERAPLLVLQGERDIRVPKEEAEHVVSILKDEGRTVDSVFYPEEGHGFVKREHQLDELTRAVDWLQRYLQTAKSP